MSLGILKVAAVLEKAAHPVEVLDLSGIQEYSEVVRIRPTGHLIYSGWFEFGSVSAFRISSNTSFE